MPTFAQTFAYQFSTSTAEPPTGSQVRFDAAAPYDAVARLWVRNETNDGRDVSILWTNLVLGSALLVQDRNESARYVTFRATGAPIAKSGYFEIPVALNESSGTPLVGQAVDVYATVHLGSDVPMTAPPTVAGHVTLQMAVDHLLIPIVLDADPIDPRQRDLEVKLAAAEAIIFGYLKTVPPEWVDENTTPPDVVAAILLQLAELWRFRGDDRSNEGANQDATLGQLSPTITNLLRRRRDPALA